MRNLFALLALFGLAGIGLGVLTMIRGTQGLNGVPFSLENHGGPGSIIAGLVLVAGGLYLRSAWQGRE